MAAEEVFEINDGTLAKYQGTDADVMIPNGVKSIGFQAFCECDSLEYLEIPESVLELDDFAIYKCPNLKSVTFKGKVPKMNEFSICDCKKFAFPSELFRTAEKLPTGLIRHVSRENVAEEEYAWLYLYQGQNSKWNSELITMMHLWKLNPSLVADHIIGIVKTIPKPNKSIKDNSIACLAYTMTRTDNSEKFEELLETLPELKEKEIEAYLNKYGNREKIVDIFQKYKEKSSKNNEHSDIKTIDPENPSLTEARSIFKLRNTENGVIIKEFIGSQEKITIPKKIGGKKVEGVEIRTFLGKDTEVLGLPEGESTYSKEQLLNAKAGDRVIFGSYFNETKSGLTSMEWIVIKKDGNRLFLLSSYTIDTLPFHSKYEAVNWENSDLRKWLNGVFFSYAFSEEEKKLIIKTIVNNDPKSQFKPKADDTEDKVFLLSSNEAGELGSRDMFGIPTPYTISKKPIMWDGCSRWWLRTVGMDPKYFSTVELNGTITGKDAYRSLGKGMSVDADNTTVRPAIWIDPLQQ